jgi:hypothetical protein
MKDKFSNNNINYNETNNFNINNNINFYYIEDNSKDYSKKNNFIFSNAPLNILNFNYNNKDVNYDNFNNVNNNNNFNVEKMKYFSFINSKNFIDKNIFFHINKKYLKISDIIKIENIKRTIYLKQIELYYTIKNLEKRFNRKNVFKK